MKKLLTLAAVLVVMALALAACNRGGADPEPPAQPTPTPQVVQQDPTPAPEPDPEPEPEVSWEDAPRVVMVSHPNVDNINTFEASMAHLGEDINDNPYNRFIFENTGVVIETIIMPSDQMWELLAVQLAGGTQIDLIRHWSLNQHLMDTGTVITLNDMFAQYEHLIPNILANVHDFGWHGAMKMDDIWGFPGRSSTGQPAIRLHWYRADWLENLGLDRPDTMDDWTELLRAFTEDDPTGTGIETWGAAPGAGPGGNTFLTAMFGLNTWFETWEDGRLIPAGHARRYRYTVDTISRWFINGYMNMEGLADVAVSNQMRMQGRIGTEFNFFEWKINIIREAREHGTEMEWSFLERAPRIGYDGERHGATVFNNMASTTMVTAMARPDNFANILRLMDWFYSPEGTFFTDIGLEGREFNMVGGQVVLDHEFLHSYLSMYRLGNSYNHLFAAEMWLDRFDDGFRDLAEKYLRVKQDNWYDLINMAGVPGAPIIDIKFEFPLAPSMLQFPDYRRTIAEYWGFFILGERDPMCDDTWAAYLALSEGDGFQQILDETLVMYIEAGGVQFPPGTTDPWALVP